MLAIGGPEGARSRFLAHFNLLIGQALVALLRPRQLKCVRDRSLPLLYGRDHVRAADPVRLFVIGLRPLGGVIGVRVVEAYDVLSALASFSLDADQFLGIDVVAIVRRISPGVAGPRGRG